MIYVVTAVHNRYIITEKFIDLLLSQTYKDIQLVLVDDGSSDGTAVMVKGKMPNAVVIQGDGNLWWGGALHKAYKWLKEFAVRDSYVLFANDDTTFDNNYIETALKILELEPHILLAGCGYSANTRKLLDGAMHWNYKTGGYDKEPSPTDIGNCASTRSLFLTLSTVLEIGGFHPVLLPHYGSDYEWTMRAVHKGIPIKSYSTLRYYFDERTTGDNDIGTVNVKKIFSKKSNMNPFYRINFILLSTPVKYLIPHLFYQISRYTKKVKKIKEIVRRKNQSKESI